MSNETYNGWTNRETWLVNLWLNDDHGTYDYWTEKALEIAGEQEDNQMASFALSNVMQEEIGGDADDAAPAGLFADLLATALGRVNWDQIAAYWINAARDDIEAHQR